MRRKRAFNVRRWRNDSGQIIIFVAIAMALFLIGFVGFAVDMTNLWFHRQTAQGAADAACQAGVMDLLLRAEGAAVGPDGNFSTAGPIDCHGSTAAPCQYASLNGYPAAAAGQVTVNFPTSVPGLSSGSLPPSALVPTSLLRVDIVDSVKVFFSPMITGRATQDVHAQATCAVVLATVPIPLIILDPTRPCTFNPSGTGNTPKIAILGGPVQSVQVNSINGTANCVNGNPVIDLSRGGPNFTGSDFGVFGGPTTAPFVFQGGTTPGQYLSPHSPIADPFSQLDAPPNPGGTPALGVNGTFVNYHVNGCPDAGGCLEYSPGLYPTGIRVKKGGSPSGVAIFDPGVYYLGGGLALDSLSTVRPSDPGAPNGDGSGGTLFYFAGAASVSVVANSGSVATTDAFQTSSAQCPGGLPPNAGIGLPSSFQGNILLGPCTGTYGQVDTDPATGATTPAHGMLFFQNRAVASGGQWGGGGQFLLAGTIYFHQCNAAGTGVGCGNPPTDYNSSFDFQGNACSSTYVLGNIVTDKLTQGGTPCIKMALDPFALQRVLKATMVR